MRHLLLLLLLGLGCYAAWTLMPKRERSKSVRSARKHLRFVIPLLLVLLAGLLVAVYTRAINII